MNRKIEPRHRWLRLPLGISLFGLAVIFEGLEDAAAWIAKAVVEPYYKAQQRFGWDPPGRK